MLGLEDLFQEDSADSDVLPGCEIKSGLDAPPSCRPPCRLAGINNQGATCYLNSLLQTLFLTPEFKEELMKLGKGDLGDYIDKDKPDARVRLIPLELQRLFSQLLLLDQQSISTLNLTDSFGWTSSESLQQHDVQELNRILFCAVEDSLVGTAGKSLIEDFYRGTVVNTVTCQSCGHVSECEESYLDLCVGVQGHASLEAGLSSLFVAEEKLWGDNQYRCGGCSHMVDALKGAKVRSLPPVLTLSLLRFSFDYVKLERVKENGKMTFPLHLSMRPFMEQDSTTEETEYDLFSVIIHSGGAHGGHYHAYIRDVDNLGHWALPSEDTVWIPTDPQTGELDTLRLDSPADLLQALVYRAGQAGTPLDKLGGEIMKQCGVSWNSRFKSRHGTLRKFIEKHEEKFTFDKESNVVGLRKYTATSSSSSGQKTEERNKGEDGCPDVAAPPPGQCWYDFNDRHVTPVPVRGLEKYYAGRESAYILVYRRACLARPDEAQENPFYGVAAGLVTEVDFMNGVLAAQRLQYEEAINTVRLELFSAQDVKYTRGALQPVVGREANPEEATNGVRSMEIDRRKPMSDLVSAIKEKFGECEDNLILHTLSKTPAGLHLMENLDTDETKTMSDVGLSCDAALLVWNGREIGGRDNIPVGPSCKPVLLEISYLAANESGNESLSRGFPQDMALSAVHELVCRECGRPVEGSTLVKLVPKGDKRVASVFSADDVSRSLADLSLRDGDALCLTAASDEAMEETLREKSRQLRVTVINKRSDCHYPEAEASFTFDTDKESSVSELKAQALSRWSCDVTRPSRLRVEDDNLGLRPPLREEQSVQEAGVRNRSLLVLEDGVPPSADHLTLFFSTAAAPYSVDQLEVTFSRRTSVAECLASALSVTQLPGDYWHLRRTNWCGEAAGLLDDLDMTLESCGVKDGDLLLVQEGHIAPKGFLSLSVYLCAGDGGPEHDLSCSDIQDQPPSPEPGLAFVGEVEISREASLQELRLQVMTLPDLSLALTPATSDACLRLRVLEAGRLRGVVRGAPETSLKNLKVGSNTQLAVEVLPHEGNLGEHDMLLTVRRRLAESCGYGCPLEVVWDTSKTASAGALRYKVAEVLGLNAEKVVLAKHVPLRHTWLVISEKSGGNKQGKGKGNKRAPKPSLRKAPYHLSDGDVIGVMLREEGDGTPAAFMTSHDVIGQTRLAAEAEEKKKQSVFVCLFIWLFIFLLCYTDL